MTIDIIFNFLLEHFRSFCAKFVLALVPAGVFIITDMHREVLAIVLWLLIIDTILGISVAIKYKKISSGRMSRALQKFLLYMSALATAYLVSCLDVPVVGYFYLYVGAFLATTEAVSIFENLAIFGLKLPKKLLIKINDEFSDVEKMREKWIDKK